MNKHLADIRRAIHHYIVGVLANCYGKLASVEPDPDAEHEPGEFVFKVTIHRNSFTDKQWEEFCFNAAKQTSMVPLPGEKVVGTRREVD